MTSRLQNTDDSFYKVIPRHDSHMTIHNSLPQFQDISLWLLLPLCRFAKAIPAGQESM